jgi:phosphoglycolate phosphatase
MKYRLVIFDFDGTLADSFPFFLGAAHQLADMYQFRKPEAQELDALRGYDARRIVNHLGLPFWKVPRVARRFRQMMAECGAQIPLFDGVEDMLHALSAGGISLGLITSNSHDNVRRVMGARAMSLLTHRECGASFFGKSGRLKRILERSGVCPSETIYVGDEIRDLDAANAANVKFGAVLWGYTRGDSLLQRSPAEAFASVGEIVHKLLAMRPAGM